MIPPNPEDTRPGLSKKWFLDAQWSDCPIEVENSVRDLWILNELGNDKYIVKTSIEDLLEYNEDYVINVFEPEVYKHRYDRPVNVKPLIQYLREKGVGEQEEVIVHWWW